MPIELYYRVYPSRSSVAAATPVVLLHGLMGYASNWGKIWPSLSEKRSVLVVDQRGHGKSPKPATGYEPSDYAADIAALLEKLNWHRAHIVGHSMGGRNALFFAHDFPKLCHSLVLEDSGMEARPDRLEWVKSLLASIPAPFPSRESAQKFFSENFANDPLLGSFLHTNIAESASGTWTWRFNPQSMIDTIASGRAVDATAIFQRITAPVLAIRGELSTEFSEAEAERMLRLRPATQLVTIAGAGHFVHPTHPEAFLAALLRFLDEVDGLNS